MPLAFGTGKITPVASAGLGENDSYRIERSLRLDGTSYFRRYFGNPTAQNKWTYSFWCKKSELGGSQNVLAIGSSNLQILFWTDDTFSFYYVTSHRIRTNQVFRDTSAWYHFVLSADFANATATERLKLYVNGSEVTSFSADNRSSTTTTPVNSNGEEHAIGCALTPANFFKGYLAEINFIDGQNLTPSSFGETDAITGRWKAKAYSGTYGNNGFYLPLIDNSAAIGSALGRDNKPGTIFTSTTPILETDRLGVDTTGSVASDLNASSLVLALSMNGTNGSTAITDRVPTNRTASAKTVTANGNAAITTSEYFLYRSSCYFDGTGDYLSIPASSDFNFGTGDFTIEWWYRWENDSGNHTLWNNNYTTANNLLIQTGAGTGRFRIYMNGNSILFTETDAAKLNQWYHYALVRSGTTVTLYRNGVSNGSGTSSASVGNSSAIVEIGGSPSNGGYYIKGWLQDFRVYKGLAKYTSSFVPSARNDWTPNNFSITAGSGNDSLVDSPTSYGTDTGLGGEVRGNYPIMSPLESGGNGTFSNGNLDVVAANSIGNPPRSSVPFPSFGMWYWEATYTTANNSQGLGIIKATSKERNTDSVIYAPNGTKAINGAASSYGSSYTNGDIIGFALNMDSGSLTCYKNNVSQGIIATGLTGEWNAMLAGGGGVSASASFNFGQRPFAYAAPSGFKCLCTSNLSSPVIKKTNAAMDIVTYTGTGSNQSFSSLVFSPSFLWIKGRSGATNHRLYDSIRGAEYLVSNSTAAAVASGTVTLDSSGFTVGTDSDVNTNTATYVGWAWNAGSTNSTNTSGSITSTVRANPQAGFSIVSYTGTGSNATVGHGLGVAPRMIIVKDRDSNSNGGAVYHASIGATKYLKLFQTTTGTDGEAVDNTIWNGGSPTFDSTRFSIGTNARTNSTNKYIAYCFSEIEGYSKFGSFTGIASADGPFVYCGFYPKFILFKSTGVADWSMYDTARDTFNVVSKRLLPNASNAESTSDALDIVSNGFKLRASTTAGVTFIFAAFAESPFKYARAR